jgi:hypothetical protein
MFDRRLLKTAAQIHHVSCIAKLDTRSVVSDIKSAIHPFGCAGPAL